MRGKSWRMGLILGLIGTLMGVQVCFGAGFALYEGSARGNALGGTLVGRADDPSALFYNPAGITQLPGLQVSAGGTVIIPSAEVATSSRGVAAKTSTEDNAFFAPNAYITYQALDSFWVGLGVFSQFGLGTEYPQDWPGRYNSYKAFIESVTINPNFAYKVTDKFSIAAGLDIIWFDLDLRRKIPSPVAGVGDIDSTLTGDTTGIGFNLALHYKLFDWLSMGASYRSQAKVDIKGDADFTKPTALTTGALAALYRDTDAEGAITLPDEFSMGVMFRPWKPFTVEVGGTLTTWSNFKSLDINFKSSPAGTGGPATVASLKDWNNVWRFQVGAEYKVLDWLALRTGYVWDESPVPKGYEDYLVPPGNRNLYSGGLGFFWHDWTLDLSYTYIQMADKNIYPNATQAASGVLTSKYENGDAHLIGVNVGYKF